MLRHGRSGLSKDPAASYQWPHGGASLPPAAAARRRDLHQGQCHSNWDFSRKNTNSKTLHQWRKVEDAAVIYWVVKQMSIILNLWQVFINVWLCFRWSSTWFTPWLRIRGVTSALTRLGGCPTQGWASRMGPTKETWWSAGPCEYCLCESQVQTFTVRPQLIMDSWTPSLQLHWCRFVYCTQR